jgi:hypothetical protein
MTSLALEEAGVYRNGFGTDLLGQREVLFDQLARAGDRFEQDGVRITIIVDGLDHIPREQNPTRSLLDELPPPAALPDGVCILIGSQTISVLPHQIRDALNDDERIVDVPPLSDGEVEAIATLAGVADWLGPGQVSTLVDRSEGHPLVLTYMIQDLRALEATDDVDARRDQAEQMLTEASEYRGSIDLRYTRYLGSLLDDHEVLSVLGTVCRLRIPLTLPGWKRGRPQPQCRDSLSARTPSFVVLATSGLLSTTAFVDSSWSKRHWLAVSSANGVLANFTNSWPICALEALIGPSTKTRSSLSGT